MFKARLAVPRIALAAAFLSSANAAFASDMNPAVSTTPDDSNFLARLYHAYADEWGMASAPADPNAPPSPPSRRPLPFPPQPENTPPYPFTDWPVGGLSAIGSSLPNSVDSPLMKAIGTDNIIGQTLNDAHIQIYGWINPGGNVSTAKTGYGGNAPAAYMYVPNIFQLDQAVVYVERVPDTVQQDHIDWGFRLSGIYGENYRFSAGYGIFANQLVYGNHFAGVDMPMIYGEVYIPGVAEGADVRFGRYISVPDIEAQLSPNSYMYSHSLTYAFDNYTNTGVIGSLKLTNNWLLQLGVNWGTETGPWNTTHISLINPATGYPGYQGERDPGAQPSITGCAQWQNDTAYDALYLCANAINNGLWGYNNLQWFGGTYYHKFDENWHIAMESYYMFQKDVPDVLQGYGNTAFAYFHPGNAPFEAICPNGEIKCAAREWGYVAFLNYKFSPLDNLTLRGEIYDDVNGQRTGFATHYNEWAFGWQHWFSPQVEIRPEIAWYHSLDKPAFDNGNKHAITIFASDLIWHF